MKLVSQSPAVFAFSLLSLVAFQAGTQDNADLTVNALSPPVLHSFIESTSSEFTSSLPVQGTAWPGPL